MAVAKIECPECEAVLRPAKPLAPGKKVRCPKCETTFVVPGAGDEPAPRGKAPAKKPAAPARKPAVPVDPIDDEDGVGTYGVLDKPSDFDIDDEDGGKPKIEYVPDLEVKDPRGPAIAAIVLPTNFLMGLGAFSVVGGIVALAVFTWPFMFTKYGTAVTPLDARKEYEKQNPPPGQQNRKDEEQAPPEVKYEDLNDQEKNIFEDLKEEDVEFRVIWAIVSVVGAVYAAFLAFAAVKFQNLESYRWSWAAVIMGIIFPLTMPFGIWGLMLLKKPEIERAFFYRAE